VTVVHWGYSKLSEESIRQVLRNFVATNKEAEVYIFLAKHGALRGGEIVSGTKTHKAIIYRSLKNLQKKGFVESTLEIPARFTAVPFEKVLDSNIKARQEETAQIESQKNELLSYLRSMSQSEPEPTLEKFVVIEGNHRIFTKISQMIRETKRQFAALVTIPGLVRADQHGLFTAVFNHPLKNKIQFRFLTELNEQDLNAIKALLREIPKTKLKIKGRNTDIGLKFSPRMAIRDEEEILFFITPKTSISATGKDETCLWTNCTELVQAFKAVFEEEWQNSSEIERQILEMEARESAEGTLDAPDPEIARNNYEEILNSAKEEILILTSSEGLVVHSKRAALFKRWAKRGVVVKIMAPIINNNLKAEEELSKFYEVRHVPASYLKITIVDGKHFFQFKLRPRPPGLPRSRTLEEDGRPFEEPSFEDIVYSNNSVHVERMTALLHDTWKNSVAPSRATLDSILDFESSVLSSPQPSASNPEEIPPHFGFPIYCSVQALIHTPTHLNMPDMLFDIHHFGEPTDEKSNWMSIYLWLKTRKGYAFVPTVVVLSRGRKDRIASQFENINKSLFAGTLAGKNVLLVKEHEFQMLKQGNTLFVGWTVPIPILPEKLLLPPSFLLFEGYGSPKHCKNCVVTASDWKITTENDSSEAFVTFISPSARYTGPGTDGRLCTNGFMSITKATN
jgi:sugar-specific transcriptional regulator TrmB